MTSHTLALTSPTPSRSHTLFFIVASCFFYFSESSKEWMVMDMYAPGSTVRSMRNDTQSFWLRLVIPAHFNHLCHSILVLALTSHWVNFYYAIGKATCKWNDPATPFHHLHSSQCRRVRYEATPYATSYGCFFLSRKLHSRFLISWRMYCRVLYCKYLDILGANGNII